MVDADDADDVGRPFQEAAVCVIEWQHVYCSDDFDDSSGKIIINGKGFDRKNRSFETC